MSDPFWRTTLDALSDLGLQRSLRLATCGPGPTIRLGERELIGFGSNDYLSLAADERIIEAVVRAVRGRKT